MCCQMRRKPECYVAAAVSESPRHPTASEHPTTPVHNRIFVRWSHQDLTLLKLGVCPSVSSGKLKRAMASLESLSDVLLMWPKIPKPQPAC